MAETIYIRMRHRIQKKSDERIFLQDLAQIIATDELLSSLKNVCLYHITEQDKNIIIIDSTRLIREIKKR
ncbi:stage V sporulation protein AA, partial [Salmonella enterica subsp. enterica serovar Typhi]|nr:stage V sporulation protein AA [Salmonella enterica subsp. enterica serovar Typhi]